MATAQLSSNKCSMCEDLIGALFCRDCEKLLCLQCRSFHDRIPSTKGHVVIDSHKEGHGIFKPKPVCTTHQKEFFSVCKDCDCLICNECILSTHNGHRLGTIKETTDTSRMATLDILENLKSKVNMTSVMLKEIRTNILPKLQSDCENFNGMVSTTSNEFLQIINHITTISKTRANDFYQLEKEPILEYLAYLECLQESYNKTCTEFENILPEKHDVTFLSAKKMLQKDLDNLEDIPQMIETKNLDAFQKGDFVNSVMEEIRQKFTVGFPKLKYSAQKAESEPTRKEPVIQERIKQDDKDTTDDEFGKPYVVESRSDSIVLQWRTEQELTANEAYHIVFKECFHGKWRPYVSIRKCITPKITISGLKASTSYIFKVKITDANTGKEGTLSIESDPITTKESPALGILTRAELIKNGPPKIYRLPLVENISARNEMAKTRKFFIGKKGTDTTERTVMIVGATGSGKSTLINGMANYIMGVTWEDPFRFTLINMETCEKAREHDQANSQTDWIRCYTIYNNISDRVNYNVNLIDTPGFGDTSGLEQDAKIVEQIRKLFNAKGEQGVRTLDAVCFILKASDARLTATQRYIFEAILSLFGKDINDNICTLITFADGQRPPVLSGIQAIDGIPLPYKTYFTFNNSALFVDNTIHTPNNLSACFWDMGIKSCQTFFNHLFTLQTKSLSLTTEVLRKRQKLENIVVNLQQEVEVGLSQIDMLEKEAAIFSRNTKAILQNKNFEYEVEEDYREKVDLTGKGYFTTNCLTCNFTCHVNCVFANDSDKEKCCAMNKEGSCTQCPKGCHWKMHHNVPYIIKWSKRRVKKRYDDMKKKYEEATQKTLTQEQLLEQMSQDISSQEEAIQVMMEIISKVNNRLKEIALRPDPLSTVQYIDLMIASEKREKKLGFEERIDALEKFKNRSIYGQQVQILQDRIRNTRQTMTAGDVADEILKDDKSVLGRIKGFYGIGKK